MFVTRNEVVGVIHYAIQKTATVLGVSDLEWRSTDELLADIEARDVDTYGLLVSFIDAFSAWYAFHEQIEAQGKTGHLDDTEHKMLTDAISKRDTSRCAILRRLESITKRHTHPSVPRLQKEPWGDFGMRKGKEGGPRWGS